MKCHRCGGEAKLFTQFGRMRWYTCQKCWVTFQR